MYRYMYIHNAKFVLKPQQNIGFMRFGVGIMSFRIRNALNPLVFQWDSWDLVQEML